MRILLIVLDSCGCGDAPDAARYGDAGSNTIGHTAAAVGGLKLPHLQAMGLGHLGQFAGVAAIDEPVGAFGVMQEQSAGKDTTTGHWEIAGLITKEPFATFENALPTALIDAFEKATGRAVLGNCAASGTAILDEFGAEHLRTGAWIVYTSADSVMQIAAHEEKISLQALYRACETARQLCDPYRIGRVIARPFVGPPGAFVRTYNRRDFGMPPTQPTILEAVSSAGLPVVGVGKIGDIYCHKGVTESIHTAGNADGIEKILAHFPRHLPRTAHGLMMVNLIDFDSLYGHRRDPQGFARCLEAFDRAVPDLQSLLVDGDLLMITADHGNDPTFAGSDHTRERVPLLVYGPHMKTQLTKSISPPARDNNRSMRGSLGVRSSYCDVAATIAEAFGLAAWPTGVSFYREVS